MRGHVTPPLQPCSLAQQSERILNPLQGTLLLLLQGSLIKSKHEANGAGGARTHAQRSSAPPPPPQAPPATYTVSCYEITREDS